jgi:NAD(P)-dependent dehydrogenase (short-subunit alcohol dehydrogenase family)
MRMQKSRVVVVTGASAGVGRAIAKEFAKEGARVGIIARGKVGLEAAAREIEALGGRALVLPLDVSDSGAVERAAAEVEQTFGPIDVWVNDAMVSVFSPVDQMRPEEYLRVTEVSYLGYVYGTLAALKRMKAQNHGVIIQIGSALAFRSIPLQSAYCAAKHAISGFSESLRTELLHDKSPIKVCQVNLPAVNTPQFGWVKSRLPRCPQPVPPIYQPELIARAVRHVSLHPRRKLDISYPAIEAILAEKISPALGDWYLSRNGFSSQQTNEPVPADRKDNLWEPIEEDRGTHGTFDKRASNRSPLLWLDLNRVPIAMSVGLAAFAMIWVHSKSRGAQVIPRENATRRAA